MLEQPAREQHAERGEHSALPCAAECAIGRRAFLVQGALAAAAVALAACGDGAGGVMAPTLSGPETVDVSAYSSLSTVGGVALVTVAGGRMAIVRTGASSFVALSRVCPHQGGIVNQASGGFQCPEHGARFDSTGQWTGGQRTGNLTSYTTSYDASTHILTIS
jgi:Rieske Fe-S protein